MNATAHSNIRFPLFTKREYLMAAGAMLVLILPVASYGADARSQDRSGKEVVDKVCGACHATGANGAPKIGDTRAWAERASQGLSALTKNALQGIRQMPAHGGHPELTDLEIGRSITYMVNRSGGHWVEPASTKDLTTERSGEQVVKAQCAKCHQSGAGGAPTIGDRDAWIARIQKAKGLDNLVHSAIKGHGGMPARGGLADLTDAEVQNGVLYMFNPVSAAAGDSRRESNVAEADIGSNHAIIGDKEIYLGFVPAENVRAFPKGSAERSMHGGIPRGSDYYHLNVSLLERVTQAPIGNAQVDVQIEHAGLTDEPKSLKPMATGAVSYGGYVRLRKNTPYVITVLVRMPGSPEPIKARFKYRIKESE